MILKVTNNTEEIKKILLDEEVFKNAASGSSVKRKDFEPPIGSIIYIAGYDKGDILGLSCFHLFRDGLKFHPYVLKKHKLRGREFVKKSIDMINCNLYIEIPDSDKLLFNLAKKLGFDSIANNKTPNRILMRLDKCQS